MSPSSLRAKRGRHQVLSFIVGLASLACTAALFAQVGEAPTERGRRVPSDLRMQAKLTEAERLWKQSALTVDEKKSELARRSLRLDESGRVRVEIFSLTETQPIAPSLIAAVGGEWVSAWRSRTEALVPVANLSEFARSLPATYEVEPLGHGLVPQAFAGNGPVVMNSDDYVADGHDGTGIKIGIIDVGYAGLLDSVSSNDAPNPFWAYNYTSTSFYDADDGSHGRFVVETAFDHAPGAEYFIFKVDGQSDVGLAVDKCIEENVDIISMSLAWYPTWNDNEGTAAEAALEAANNGILFFVSAGNFAQKHWQGDFNDTDGDDWLNWAGTADEGIAVCIADGDSVTVAATWDRSGGTHDYDLYLYDFDFSTVLDSSTAGGETYESVSWTNNTGSDRIINIAVSRESGGGTEIEIFGGGLWLQHIVEESSLLTPCNATHSSVISVGGVIDDSYGSAKYTGGIIADYSSRGPTNQGVSGPDICAPTHTNGSFFNTFTGTSCACPNAAGMCASLWSVNPAGTAAQVRNQLFAWADAKDWGAPGFDQTYGRGGVHYPAMADCNGNGWPDAFDIASGGSDDDNGNGQPDECDFPGYSFGLSTTLVGNSNPVVGPLTFQAVTSICVFNPTGGAAPLATGFSQAIATNPSYVSVSSVALAPVLAELNGGDGPDFVATDLLPSAAYVSVIFGGTAAPTTLDFATKEDVLIFTCTPGPSAGDPTADADLRFLAGGNSVETLSGSFPASVPAPTPIEFVVESGFAFKIEDDTVRYNLDTGYAAFSALVSIVEENEVATPTPTDGFHMAIRHDDELLTANGVEPGSALSAMNGGLGPDVFLAEVLATGVIIEAQWDNEPIGPEPLPVGEIDFESVGTPLAGNLDGTSTSLMFDDDLGPNVVLIDDTEYPVDLEQGMIDLVPAILAPQFLRGDVSADGAVQINDAILLLDHLFGGGPLPSCPDAADGNDDGGLGIADAVTVLSYLFGGGALATPGPLVCGVDPTPDGLSDCTYDACP